MLQDNKELTGFEIITNDDVWWVVNVWETDTFRTKLFEKSICNFPDVLDWLRFQHIIEG